MDVLTRSLSESVLASCRTTRPNEAIFRFMEGLSSLLAQVGDEGMNPSKVAVHQVLIKQASELSFGLPVPCATLWAVNEAHGRKWTTRQLALVSLVGQILTTHSFDHATLATHFASLNTHLKEVIAEGSVSLDIYDRAMACLRVVAHYMR